MKRYFCKYERRRRRRRRRNETNRWRGRYAY